jgi:hypothetical protein
MRLELADLNLITAGKAATAFRRIRTRTVTAFGVPRQKWGRTRRVRGGSTPGFIAPITRRGEPTSGVK